MSENYRIANHTNNGSEITDVFATGKWFGLIRDPENPARPHRFREVPHWAPRSPKPPFMASAYYRKGSSEIVFGSLLIARREPFGDVIAIRINGKYHDFHQRLKRIGKRLYGWLN